MNKRELRQLFQGVGLQFTLHNDYIECSMDWPPVHMFAAFKSSPRGNLFSTPVRFIDFSITLPIWQGRVVA